MSTNPVFDPSQHPRDAGGQFAQKVTAEGPPITVDDVYRNDEGSFRYPPMPPTAAQMTHFWCNVEVPEDLLGRFHRAYGRMVDDEKLTELSRTFDAQNPQPEDEAGRARWEQARQIAWGKVEDRYRNKFMPLVFIRPLARVERMHRYSRYLPELERKKFEKQTWTMPDGRSRTAQEWVKEYDLVKVGRALDAHSDVDEVEQTGLLQSIHEEMRNMRFLEEFGSRPNQQLY